MVVDEGVLARLERLTSAPFASEVFRHTLGATPPEKENNRGARWNPPGIHAIYTSLERPTAIAEGEHLLSLQVPRPRVRRVVHRIRVSLSRVFDLRSARILENVGVTADELRSDDHWGCRRVGEAANHLSADGLLVPSARSEGTNLVVLPRSNPGTFQFEVLESVVIDEGV